MDQKTANNQEGVRGEQPEDGSSPREHLQGDQGYGRCQ
jgi:hypothetical protein